MNTTHHNAHNGASSNVPDSGTQLIIDAEFKALIPPLSTEEYEQLEANIQSEGCRDALVVWNGTLIDGHNRYEICSKHSLTFQTVERKFEDKGDAKEWIIRNQFGRRNIAEFVRDELALRLKGVLEERARQRMLAGKRDPHSMLNEGQEWTMPQIAKISDSSVGTLHKVETVLKKAPEQLLAKARSGKISRNAAYNLTKALEQAPVEVKSVVLDNDIERPDVVETLTDAYRVAPELIQEMVATGFIQPRNEEESKPLSEMTVKDLKSAVDDVLTERHQRQLQHVRDGIRKKTLDEVLSGKHAIWYADPPWQYSNSGLNGAAEKHYETMATADICAIPVADFTTTNGALFLWTTNSHIPDALQVIEAWGFTYRANFVWVKDRPAYGNLAWYNRGQHELLFVATKGSFVPNVAKELLPVSLIESAKGEHSAKPPCVREIIEGLYPDYTYVELFARWQQPREGWTFWGDQSDAA